MICLHYRDERELAEAFLSLARRCQALSTRILFLGSEKKWDIVRKQVGELEPSALQSLIFHELSLQLPENLADPWTSTIEAVRLAFFEAAVVSGPITVWIEAPLPSGTLSLRSALREYYQSLGTTPLSSTIISAYDLDSISESVRAGLLDTYDTVISAKQLIPACPSWLINQSQASATYENSPSSNPPTCDDESELKLTTFEQSEKLSALGQLVAGVAHELGNPLSIISSSLQYLHQRLAAANDPASDFTMTALANVERMHGLLRSMLNFATVKKSPVKQVDLKESVSEVLRFTAEEFARRNIAVEVAYDPSLPRVWVDPCGVKQIVLNLAKNSLDAMAQAGSSLRVCTRMENDSHTAVVEIENNGPSIPPEVLSHLFRPFHTTKDGGTGLGLYLSRQIAKENGGELVAENLPKGGVRFSLTLPIDRRKGEEDGRYSDRR
jgi:signal transduction histidine kinase